MLYLWNCLEVTIDSIKSDKHINHLFNHYFYFNEKYITTNITLMLDDMPT